MIAGLISNSLFAAQMACAAQYPAPQISPTEVDPMSHTVSSYQNPVSPRPLTSTFPYRLSGGIGCLTLCGVISSNILVAAKRTTNGAAGPVATLGSGRPLYYKSAVALGHDLKKIFDAKLFDGISTFLGIGVVGGGDQARVVLFQQTSLPARRHGPYKFKLDGQNVEDVHTLFLGWSKGDKLYFFGNTPNPNLGGRLYLRSASSAKDQPNVLRDLLDTWGKVEATQIRKYATK